MNRDEMKLITFHCDICDSPKSNVTRLSSFHVYVMKIKFIFENNPNLIKPNFTFYGYLQELK